jgi:hypothetical protein
VKKSDSDPIEDREIVEMLHGLAGPPEPHRPSPVVRSSARAIATFAAAVAVVFPVVAVARWLAGQESNSSAGCAVIVSFGERRYIATEIHRTGALRSVGVVVGVGTVDPCSDEPGVPPDNDFWPPPRLVSVDGIDPEVALLDTQHEEIVYIAIGRCGNLASGWDGYVACLRERLVVRGRLYSRVRFSEDLVHPPEQVGAAIPAIKESRDERRPTEVRAIRGVPIERAVSAAADRRDVWVADGYCYDGVRTLIECLRRTDG